MTLAQLGIAAAGAGLRAARAELSYRWRLAGHGGRGAAEAEVDLPIAGRYLISSERGIYELAHSRLRRLSPVPAFGMAVIDGTIYLATWYQGYSTVVRGRLERLLSGQSPDWQEIYRINILTEAGRIHQIAAAGDALWLANTSRNAYTKIDRHTGAWMGNVTPFRCSFGHPLLVDHNHVNGVFPQAGYLLCAAFKINTRSAFALCGEGRIDVFAYPNMGVHDCLLTGDDFLFCDSYRMWQGARGGAPVRNGRLIDEAYFDSHPAYFVRALAGEGRDMLVGNSHAGEADRRFAGSGALILMRDDRVMHSTDVPFAQIYEILREDGTHFDLPPKARSFSEAREVLTRSLGAPVESFALRDMLCGERAKKFSEGDLGHVEEYL
jgi:hypothetical protein